jgi:putative ABC transport system permease protein
VPIDRWKLQFSMFTITYGDFFRAMGIPLIDGRVFTPEDRSGKPLVILVNQSMAAHCWPGQRAIGKRMHVGNPKKDMPWATVVGVVADTPLGSRDQPTSDQWYAPAEQPAVLRGSSYSGALTQSAGGFITLRSTLPPEQMIQVLRSTVATIDPQLALQDVRPMTEVISNTEAPRRFNTTLITAFALGALLLALTGMYAVVAFSVSLRAQEIAIRMALGAQRSSIARLVLVSGAKLALIGCVLGLIASFAVARMVSDFLFDVSATDPLVCIAAAMTMMLLALLASALPARRAASADPIQALRSI